MAADFPHAYTWLVARDDRKGRLAPAGRDLSRLGVVHAECKHKKPDLRSERWDYGAGGEDYCCIELEIAPERVLLSDFDEWHIVLYNGLVSDTEEEDIAQEALYESLSDEERMPTRKELGARLRYFPFEQWLDDARRMGAGDVLGTQARGCLRRALFSHRQVQALSRRAMRAFRRKKPPPLCQRSGFSVDRALNPPTARARR